MIEAAAYPGWEDFSAMTAHLRFVRDHPRLLTGARIDGTTFKVAVSL